MTISVESFEVTVQELHKTKLNILCSTENETNKPPTRDKQKRCPNQNKPIET